MSKVSINGTSFRFRCLTQDGYRNGRGLCSEARRPYSLWFWCLVSISVDAHGNINVCITSSRRKGRRACKFMRTRQERNCLPSPETHTQNPEVHNSSPCMIAKWSEGQVPF